MGIYSSVDESHTVRSAGRERDIETLAAIVVRVRSVDQAIVQCRWPTGLSACP